MDGNWIISFVVPSKMEEQDKVRNYFHEHRKFVPIRVIGMNFQLKRARGISNQNATCFVVCMATSRADPRVALESKTWYISFLQSFYI
jgi:hypothetical protein